jgi:DNA polymerase I
VENQLKNALYDIETNGLLPDCTKFHCLVIKDLETGEKISCADQPGYKSIDDGLRILEKAETRWAHNGIDFDEQAIIKLRPWWKPRGRVRDTLILTRLIWGDTKDADYRLAKKNLLPAQHIGSHSLEAWGYRLKCHKAKYEGGWEKWSRQMQVYCERDTDVLEAIVKLVISREYPEEPIELEHDFAKIIAMMTSRGWAFDADKATGLVAELAGLREQLTGELQEVFPPRKEQLKTPAYYSGVVGGKRIKFERKGAAVVAKAADIKPGPPRVKLHPFKPSSRQQVAARLVEMGWKPAQFTDGGSPKVDDEVLKSLPYPQAKPLARLFLINKRLGQISEGQQAWLKNERDGRVYFNVNTLGCVTRRCTHSNFNIAQVPGVALDDMKKLVYGEPGEWGTECRALFGTTPGMVLVGADASGLELRGLAHYLARYDGGEYVKAVIGPDIHSVNQRAFCLPPGPKGRKKSKNGIYCLIYGGGDEKLGWTLDELEAIHEKLAAKEPISIRQLWAWFKELGIKPARVQRVTPEVRKRWESTLLRRIDPKRVMDARRGAYARRMIVKNIKGYGELSEAVIAKFEEAGFLTTIDGGRIPVRKRHAALNALLQCWGALVVKYATVLWYRRLIEQGLVYGRDFALLGHIHDEIQSEARPEHAQTVGKAFVWALQEVGKRWKIRCPLTGEFKVGKNWSETH